MDSKDGGDKKILNFSANPKYFGLEYFPSERKLKTFSNHSFSILHKNHLKHLKRLFDCNLRRSVQNISHRECALLRKVASFETSVKI